MPTNTAYEVVLECGEFRERLGFTARKTKQCLMEFARCNRDQILGLLGDADPVPTYDRKAGWAFGPVKVRFSGETLKSLKTQGKA